MEVRKIRQNLSIPIFGKFLGGIGMEEEILREIMRECENWKERLVVKMFTRLFVKVYKMGITFGFNNK